MRRWHVFAAGVAVLVVFAQPAFAEDLTPLLERSRQSDFSGEQFVSCATPDGSREASVAIVQAAGVVRVTSRDGAEVVADRGVAGFSNPDGTAEVTTVDEGSQTPTPTGYTVAVAGSSVVLGRAATRYSVTDAEGIERARMTFDSATGTLIRSEILNGDGTLYCDTRMIEFTPGNAPTPTVPGGSEAHLEPITPNDDRLPQTLGGFERGAVFAWNGGGELGYYTDGLFSFTLLATPSPITLDAEGSTDVPSEHGAYRRWFGAGQAMYAWEDRSGGMALLGDLPLDLQEIVLAELPAPQDPGFFTRLFRRFFG